MNQQGRFDKFTERARLCLSLAQEEARRLQQNYIGTEHLLLGLINIEDGAAIQVLRKLDVDPQQVRAAVAGIIGRGHDTVRSIMALTPRAKKVIELAVDEARRMNHSYIGTEHLLLGLIREGEGIAADVLERLGVKLDNARTAVHALVLNPEAAPGSTSSGMRSAQYSPIANPTPEQTRALFEQTFAHQSTDQIRETVERFRLTAEITQQLLAEREASQDETELSGVEQETARTAPPAPDTAAFGPSEASQKTPAQTRQMIATIRQHMAMLEQMLNEEESSHEQQRPDEHGDV